MRLFKGRGREEKKVSPLILDPTRPRKEEKRGEWKRGYHLGSPYGNDNLYYSNEAPYDDTHTLVRLVPNSSLEIRYERANEETLNIVYKESPSYAKVTREYIQCNHTPLWQCGRELR